MTATARPWAYSRRNWRNEPDAHSFYITGDRHEGDEEDEGDYSTAVAIVCGNATAGTIPEDNAKLIVRAVNCHDDLLAACKALVDWIATKPCDLTWEQEKELEQPAFDLGCAAIAKAESA